MYKVIFLLVVPFLLSPTFINYEKQGTGETGLENNKTMSISDLTPEQKAEAIAHFKATGDCEYNGIKLYGKVQFVTSFPDIKIQYVESFPDIRVKFVTSFPDDCGEWEIVESFPDFKVEVVESFPDLKVKKVDSFPGME